MGGGDVSKWPTRHFYNNNDKSEMCTTVPVVVVAGDGFFNFLHRTVGASVDRKVEFLKVTICWNNRNIYPVADNISCAMPKKGCSTIIIMCVCYFAALLLVRGYFSLLGVS